MEELDSLGSTAILYRVRTGVVLKAAVQKLEDQVLRERQSVENNYITEQKILERLRKHPRIVRYFGSRAEFPAGLLLAEASHGSLQHFLDTRNYSTPLILRKRLFQQAIESIVYIHSRGVIHSDLRPENLLVHASTPTTFDLWLCDFGGSVCKELDVDGGSVPDAGFFDPNSTWESTPATDIFSLGSVLYTIVTGRWPYQDSGPFKSADDMEHYGQRVDDLFGRREFPNVEGLFGGKIIMRCWRNEYISACEVLRDVEVEMMT